MGLFRRKKRPRQPKSLTRNIIELVATVAVAIGLALLVEAFLVKPYQIPSLSMYPTITKDQHVLVNRLDTHPGIGDIVVFHPPSGAAQQRCGNVDQGPGHAAPCDRSVPGESSDTYIKRVVGLPGDHLLIKDGYVYRNGTREQGTYPNTSMCSDTNECSFTQSITVPAGEYYMMGDNRGFSDDSRYWGPLPQRYIIGVAFFTYWPIDRIGFF